MTPTSAIVVHVGIDLLQLVRILCGELQCRTCRLRCQPNDCTVRQNDFTLPLLLLGEFRNATLLLPVAMDEEELSVEEGSP